MFYSDIRTFVPIWNGGMMKRKKFLLGITTLLLILVILFCTTETGMSHYRSDTGRDKQYYALMEKEYLSGMERLLEEKGYSNSGITIRWISDEDGMRTYTVMIHHRKIDRLDVKEKEALIRELSETEFSGAGCTFCYEFLTV